MTSEEVERYKEEVGAYGQEGYNTDQATLNLEDNCEEKCPVYLDGEGVGAEVSGQRRFTESSY